MKNITVEMQKIIQENLPSATAGAMSDFIDEAEQTASDLIRYKEKLIICEEKLTTSEKAIKGFETLVRDFNEMENREKGLNIREQELDVRERDIKLEICEIELMNSRNQNNIVQSLVEKVFGHPSVSISTTKLTPIMTDQNGNTPYQSGCSSATDYTDTKQEKV